MTRIADLLDLPRDGADRLWVVASNGAVVFRYPPIEVVHEETFDAGPAVAAVLREHPGRLVAVEERGVGYRVNRPFPDGELSGDMIITEVDDIVAEPVSRVIIRDPDATAEDFVDLAARLGLHGTDYVVGWTAWLDLPRSASRKASGLAHVAERSASTRPTCSPSATAATTSRCCAGPAAGWRWARPSRRSTRPPTTSPPPSTTTAPPSRSRCPAWFPDRTGARDARPVHLHCPDCGRSAGEVARYGAGRLDVVGPSRRDLGHRAASALDARRADGARRSWSSSPCRPRSAEDVRERAGEPPRGFGSVRVRVEAASRVEHQRLPRRDLGRLRAAGEEGRTRRRGVDEGDERHGHPLRPGRRVSSPRLVATDLDGTLCTPTARSRRPPARCWPSSTSAASRSCSSPGVRCGGRGPVEHVGGHGLAMISNGALV